MSHHCYILRQFSFCFKIEFFQVAVASVFPQGVFLRKNWLQKFISQPEVVLFSEDLKFLQLAFSSYKNDCVLRIVWVDVNFLGVSVRNPWTTLVARMFLVVCIIWNAKLHSQKSCFQTNQLPNKPTESKNCVYDRKNTEIVITCSNNRSLAKDAENPDNFGDSTMEVASQWQELCLMMIPIPLQSQKSEKQK